MPNVLTEEKETEFEKEVHRFNSDPTIPQFVSDIRIDHWWAAIETYPILRKVVLGGLTCFHGPLVEGCFNLMGDVTDAESARLGVNSLNALQTVKSHLSAQDSLEYFNRKDHLHDLIVPGLNSCMINASKEKRKSLALKKSLREERKQKLENWKQAIASKRSATEMASRAIKKTRLDHIQRCTKNKL